MENPGVVREIREAVERVKRGIDVGPTQLEATVP